MNGFLLCLATALAGDARVEVRVVDGETLVDASGTSVGPAALLRRLAEGSGRELRGAGALDSADPLDVHVQARPLESVLRAIAMATNTEITCDARGISTSPARERTRLEELDLDAQAAWLRLVRDYPDHEASRAARYQLGCAQERLGHEDAALAHYDAAVRADVASPAMERALQAASDLLARRGDWGEAQRRLSQLAVLAAEESVRTSARIATARVLAMQGRGPEALGLLDAVDLSYPARGEQEAQDRRLVRARAELAAGNAAAALSELDRRAAAQASFGFTREDLELRARALEGVDAVLEASRAWLACASLSSGRERKDALAAAAQLAAAGGDDIGVLFIARLDEGDAPGRPSENTDAGRVRDLAAAAEDRLGTARGSAGRGSAGGASAGGGFARTVEALESSWKRRARLAPSERVELAARCIPAIASARSVEEATEVARTAMSELDGADGAPVRAALAASYERRGLWSEAARVWSGSNL